MIHRFLLFYAGNEQGYYQDTRHFTEQIAEELRRRGHLTFICDLTKTPYNTADMNAYLMAGVDAILTFNGEALEKKELWQLWNQLEILVVNILMDPPFHIDLCPYLEGPYIRRYLLLCPDENHVKFVRQYFPHVPHVEFMPHGGTPSKGNLIPWKERTMDLLFCGTYIRPEKFFDVMKYNMEPEEFRFYTDMGERLLQDGNLSVEQAISEACLTDTLPLTQNRVHREIPAMNLLEGWLRMLVRERTVMTLIEGGINLHVLGAGWQECPCWNSKYFHSLSMNLIPYPDTLPWMEQAKINLNIMPWFKAGSHDRVFNAMLRKSVALTDPSSYFRNYFQDRDSIVYYSLQNLKGLPGIVHDLLAQPKQAEVIAENGYNKAAAFTWENYVEELLEKVDRFLK